ncbi:MAG: hypothetical protein LBU11_04085 [Zoogloeaceae bacterium]|nr:hypothetical protein [Zoogloeaceae bacterium]
MKISLIKPTIGRREHSLYVDEGCMEPLMLGVLAGLTPSDVEVVLHDDRMETIPYDEPTDLAAITVETFTARRTYGNRCGIPAARGAGGAGRHSRHAPARRSGGASNMSSRKSSGRSATFSFS